MSEPPEIAVILPCFNEAATIAKVVGDFARALPEAAIYVFDNNSTDETALIAANAGAQVIPSPRQGKGNVIRHMGESIEADLYVIADGDDTYPAEAAPELIQRFRDSSVDMLVATRLIEHDDESFRTFHRFGNHVVSKLVSILFSASVTDVLSGYRILSRDLVKLIRLRAPGFEVETEMTLQALTKRFEIEEVAIRYRSRPTGSVSKLNTWSDGYLIIKCIFLILKDYRPLLFFTAIAGLFAIGSVASGIGPVVEFYETGLVLRIPRAILAVGLGLLSALSLLAGLILDTISKYHIETVELWKQQLRKRN
jgi:glycosyltransferase involved in cell wall biosynthesis